MFGLPIEIITMLGSSLFSGIMTMMAAGRKHQYELMKAALTQNKQDNANQLQQLKADKGFSWTRRVIALTVVGVSAAGFLVFPLLDIGTTIPLESTSNFLFGLFSDTSITYKTVQGFVLPDWWSTAFTSIIGLYFGHSMCK